MNKHLFLTAATLALLNFGCSGPASKSGGNRMDVVVSIPPQEYLVKAIGGDLVNVKTVMGSNANPESFEPTVASMRSSSDADIYIPRGSLDFEKNLIDKLRENSPGLNIAYPLDGINLLYGTHVDCEHDHHDHDSDHHHHDAADPHVWSSPKNMAIMARNIAGILSSADPDNKAAFAQRCDSIINRIDSIGDVLSRSISGSGQRSFMVWHPSLSYLANDYSLNQIVVGSHNKELSVKQLQDRIDQASNSGATLLFIQKEFDTSQAKTLNRQIKATIIELNTMSEDWEAEVKKITDGFSKK